MKVLVVPEDQQLDSFIVKPIVERLFEELGRKARVEVLPEPRLRGSSQALDPEFIRELIVDNPMVDLFLLMLDKDCNRERHVERAAALEREHAKLVACLAEQEVECWMLALHEAWPPSSAPWREIREHCDPKEAFAEPFLRARGSAGPGRGRKEAMRALAGNWRRLLALSPELALLEARLREWLAAPR